MKRVWYVGYHKEGDYTFTEVVPWDMPRKPERDDHAGRYFAVWGPFRTLRGARLGAEARGPQLVLASDCDRAARTR